MPYSGQVVTKTSRYSKVLSLHLYKKAFWKTKSINNHTEKAFLRTFPFSRGKKRKKKKT